MNANNQYLHRLNLLPKTCLGKWSVGLQTFFLMSVIISILLTNVFGILSYGDRWWDVTVPIIFLASIVALVLGVIAIQKRKDSTVLVYVSIGIGLLAIFFIFSHSLFIND